MAFEQSNNQILIFGGRTGKYAHGDMNDLWGYHLPVKKWAEIKRAQKKSDPV